MQNNTAFCVQTDPSLAPLVAQVVRVLCWAFHAGERLLVIYVSNVSILPFSVMQPSWVALWQSPVFLVSLFRVIFVDASWLGIYTDRFVSWAELPHFAWTVVGSNLSVLEQSEDLALMTPKAGLFFCPPGDP